MKTNECARISKSRTTLKGTILVFWLCDWYPKRVLRNMNTHTFRSKQHNVLFCAMHPWDARGRLGQADEVHSRWNGLSIRTFTSASVRKLHSKHNAFCAFYSTDSSSLPTFSSAKKKGVSSNTKWTILADCFRVTLYAMPSSTIQVAD